MRRVFLLLALAAIVVFVAVQGLHNQNKPMETKQSETERRCRYLGHNAPDDLRECIWAHKAEEMSKWRPSDWEDWRVLNGKNSQDVLALRTAVFLWQQRRAEGK